MNKILKITLALCLSFTFFACSEDENKVETELSFNDTSKFLESVALIRTGVKTETNAKNTTDEKAWTLDWKNSASSFWASHKSHGRGMAILIKNQSLLQKKNY